jgi:hypothetical protein
MITTPDSKRFQEAVASAAERFIGEKDVRFVERLVAKHRKSYDQKINHSGGPIS